MDLRTKRRYMKGKGTEKMVRILAGIVVFP